MKQVSVWIIGMLLFLGVLGAEKRDLLLKNFSENDLQKSLAKGQEWVGFPNYNDRNFWNKQPETIRTECIRKGEAALSFNWDIVKATDYLALGRTGSREQMQQPNSARTEALKSLLMAELMEGEGRFMDQIVNGVWAICEQSNWVLSAHLSLQKEKVELPDINNMVIDLGSGETGALLAWIHYFLKTPLDVISPLIAERIEGEVKRNILDPYYTRNDLWWMGLGGEKTNNPRGLVNNWNPWINFNVLQCILLIEPDEVKRVKYTYKTMHSVDQFINSYNNDGACDEGPSYWSHAGGKFFEYLELIHQATNGKITIYNDALVKNIGTYIYQVYIDDPYFVNFADASAKGGVNAGLVYRYGTAIHDTTMKGFGSFYAQKKKLGMKLANASMYAMLQDLQWMPKVMADKAIEPLVGEYWFPQTAVAGGREVPGAKEGFYFAAKGGHNDEFHNHNDVGSFILYYNGLPCLVDAGVGTYTKQTFSKDRYKIWTMQSGFHNLPVINGYEQSNGTAYHAENTRFTSNGNLYFATDIAKAYPPEAGVQSWIRSYGLDRKKGRFKIEDKFKLTKATEANVSHFLSASKPTLVKPGLLKIQVGGEWLYIRYATKVFHNPEIIPVVVEDPRLLASWPNGLYKWVFKAKQTAANGSYLFEITKQPD